MVAVLIQIKMVHTTKSCRWVVIFTFQLGGPSCLPGLMLEKRKICCTGWESFPWLSNNSVLPIPTTLSQFKIINKYTAFQNVYKSAT